MSDLDRMTKTLRHMLLSDSDDEAVNGMRALRQMARSGAIDPHTIEVQDVGPHDLTTILAAEIRALSTEVSVLHEYVSPMVAKRAKVEAERRENALRKPPSQSSNGKARRSAQKSRV